jgi:hypothetical protein
MGLLKRRLARRLRECAWKLDPIQVPTSARLDCPATDAVARVFADALSHEHGHRVGVDYQRVDGSAGHVA